MGEIITSESFQKMARIITEQQEKGQHPFVENAPGYGRFEIQTKIEGDVVKTEEVLGILSLPGDEKPCDDYLQEQLNNGELIAAFRYGDRGLCKVKINTKAFNVKSVIRHSLGVLSDESRPMHNFSFKSEIMINAVGSGDGKSRLTVIGRTFEGLNIEQNVIFQPTNQLALQS